MKLPVSFPSLEVTDLSRLDHVRMLMTGILDFFRRTAEAVNRPHVTAVPLTGDTITLPLGQKVLWITPAGAIATLNVTLPPGRDEDPFEIATTQDISALNVSAAAGDTLLGVTGTVLAAGGGTSWRFNALDRTWYPRY
jgi:hypothetical protein